MEKGKITVTITLNDPELIEHNPNNQVKTYELDGVVLLGTFPKNSAHDGISSAVGSVNPVAVAEGLVRMKELWAAVKWFAPIIESSGDTPGRGGIDKLLKKLGLSE